MVGKDAVLDILMQQDQAHYNMERTKVYFRCPYCSDSKSNRHETSFNVRIPDETEPRWLYICFRSDCRAHGAITPEFLRMLGANNHQANAYLNKVNRSQRKEKRFKNKYRRSAENFPTPQSPLTMAKLAYLNKRLGTKLTLKDLLKLKIHLDMDSLYKYNELSYPPKRASYYRKLSAAGIAFISAYNDYLIVRNASSDPKIARYTVVDMFEGQDDGAEKFKFYVIPTKVDVMSVDPVVLNLAEGTFDILSVYFNLEIGKEYENRIYAAVAGSSYENALIHLIRQYGLVDIHVNIFSDDNIDISQYEKLYRTVIQYTNSMTLRVHYNDIGKDFGVPKDEIKVRTTYIK